MIDVATKEPVKVQNDEATGPYIRLSKDQQEIVHKVLKEATIPHWLQRGSWSVNHGPYMTYLFIRKGVDPVRVQELLDGLP